MKYTIIYFFITLFFLGCASNNNPKEEKNNSTITEKKVMADTTKTNDTTLVATIKTNMGTIELELFDKLAPKTVENFVGLAEKGYYKGVIFHRVIDGFMIQGGDPTGTGRGGASLWGGKFDDEIVPSLTFDGPGILAMANAGPNTNGSQFFITLAATPWLNGHYSLFGKVIKGMDVVQAIGKTKTGANDKPVKDVVMEDVTIEKKVK
jgi:cyclophilin family peptidyl-prolyl cis-trans isomerase